MGFDIQIAHSIREIGQDVWNTLAQGRPFASYCWYRFGEEVLDDNLPTYIVLYHQGRPVAGGAFWLRRQEQLPISSEAVRRLLEAVILRWPLLMCQSPLVETSGLILPAPPLRDAALRTIAETARDQAQRHGASFLGCLYLERSEIQYTGWPDTFTTIEVPDPGTRMIIRWSDFESYLGHLDRRTRKHYRQNCRHAAELGIEVKLEEIVTDIDRAMTLIRNVEKKHHSSPYPWTRKMLEKANLIDAVWITAKVEDRLVGCELMMADNDAWCVKALGLDYDFQYVYFVLSYADIRCAIEKSARVLRWGSGAYDTKRRLGFQLESNNNVAFTSTKRVFQTLGRLPTQM